MHAVNLLNIANQQIFVHLWGTIMQGPYNMGFNHGLQCYVKIMAPGTRVDKSRGRRRKWCLKIPLCIFYMRAAIGRIYISIYTQQECHSVLAKLHPIHIGLYFWGVRSSWVECHFCFLWFTNCVLLSDDTCNSLIPGLWLLVFVLNNTLILGSWCSTIPHLPGCFCPWTFFQNMGFNMVPSDPVMSHLATQLGYSAGEFQVLQLIVLAAFGVVD